MTLGTVGWFDIPKGYGFIKPDDGRVDVLVTICAVERAKLAPLVHGQRLSFEIVRDERTGRFCAERLSATDLQPGQLDNFEPLGTSRRTLVASLSQRSRLGPCGTKSMVVTWLSATSSIPTRFTLGGSWRAEIGALS
jgi:CspA family cold shock protein